MHFVVLVFVGSMQIQRNWSFIFLMRIASTDCIQIIGMTMGTVSDWFAVIMAGVFCIANWMLGQQMVSAKVIMLLSYNVFKRAISSFVDILISSRQCLYVEASSCMLFVLGGGPFVLGGCG